MSVEHLVKEYFRTFLKSKEKVAGDMRKMSRINFLGFVSTGP